MSGFGHLAHQPDLKAEICGIKFDSDMPTRREEYGLVWNAQYDIAYAGLAFDAGCGANPKQHVLPEILAELGWRIFAIDSDPKVLEMPKHPRIARCAGNMALTGFPEGMFDLITCISTLEHIAVLDVFRFAQEAARLTREGGLLVVTADELPPGAIADWFRPWFNVGKRAPEPEEFTKPRVAYLVARRNEVRAFEPDRPLILQLRGVASSEQQDQSARKAAVVRDSAAPPNELASAPVTTEGPINAGIGSLRSIRPLTRTARG